MDAYCSTFYTQLHTIFRTVLVISTAKNYVCKMKYSQTVCKCNTEETIAKHALSCLVIDKNTLRLQLTRWAHEKVVEVPLHFFAIVDISCCLSPTLHTLVVTNPTAWEWIKWTHSIEIIVIRLLEVNDSISYITNI